MNKLLISGRPDVRKEETLQPLFLSLLLLQHILLLLLLLILFHGISVLLVLSLLAADSICLIVFEQEVHIVLIIIELRSLNHFRQCPRVLVLPLARAVQRLMHSGYLGRLPVASFPEGLSPGLQGVGHLINLSWRGLITKG